MRETGRLGPRGLARATGGAVVRKHPGWKMVERVEHKLARATERHPDADKWALKAGLTPKEEMAAIALYKAYELSDLASDGMPDTVRTAIEMVGECACGHGRHEEVCARCACVDYRHRATLGEVAVVIKILAGLSRHEARLDNDLGFNKQEQREVIAWMPGTTVAEWKGMTAEEQDARMLALMGGRVVEAEKVDKEAGDGGAG
jgi:hypothetical protein